MFRVQIPFDDGVTYGPGPTNCDNPFARQYRYSIDGLYKGQPLNGCMRANSATHLREILKARHGIQIKFIEIVDVTDNKSPRERNRAIKA